MTSIKYIVSIFFASILFSACEITIDYDLPQIPDRITIETRLTAGDSASVIVGTSKYALSNKDPEFLNFDATVWLYENNIPVSQLIPTPNTSGINFSYTSNYQLKTNQVYKVEAAINGYSNAFGEGLLKEPVPINSTEYDSINRNLKFTFHDPPTAGDYYMITLSAGFQSNYPIYFSTNDISIDFFVDESFSDPFGGNEEDYGDKGYFTDQYFNGKDKSIRITILDEGFQFNNVPLTIELWRINKDLYDHERTKAVAWESENPFSEPVQIYSNIENGYGIVGTVAVSKRQFYP